MKGINGGERIAFPLRQNFNYIDEKEIENQHDTNITRDNTYC